MGIRFEISEVQMGLGPLGLLGYEKLKQYLRSKGALFWRRGGGVAPKSLQMVIAAMKLKDAYSLEGKL